MCMQTPKKTRGAIALRKLTANEGSLVRLARALGTSRWTLARWRAGVTIPDAAQAAVLERDHGIPCSAWAEGVR